MVLITAMIRRRSPAVGARVARIRQHSSSMLTSMRLTLSSSSATLRPSSLLPSASARIPRASCSSTSPPIVSTELRTRSRSSLKRREMWCPRSSTSIAACSCRETRTLRFGGLYDRPSGCAFRAAAPRDPLRRETARECAAFTLATLDRERRAVPLQRVLDDREAEPRAARRARTAGIDSIEALGDPRDLILGDADAGILHRELRPLAARTPRDVDPSGRRRETHRVVDQIVEDRVELRFAAKQREVGLEMKLKSASLGAPRELLDDPSEQRRNVDELLRRGRLGRLEPRELDQILEDLRHTI